MTIPRQTINDVRRTDPVNEWTAKIADAGRRRFLSYGADFDTRAIILEMEIQPDWEDKIKALWEKNKAAVEHDLKLEFGEAFHQQKVANFIAIKSAPFSILSYHNNLFHQIRRAFIQILYYPALVGACALGERMLNHLSWICATISGVQRLIGCEVKPCTNCAHCARFPA